MVICPNCSQMAVVRTDDFSFRNYDEKTIKVVCTKCGFNKVLADKPTSILFTSNENAIKGRHMIIGASVDPFFNYPLWLRENIGEHLLWAYNFEHLEFLRQHVASKLRERNDQEPSYMNKSLGSRLPKWMTSKNNREAVLRTIEKLKR